MTRDPYASLKQGLVGAWIPSISGSGLLLPDLSGRGNNGALTNMDASDWVSSGSGRALDFDGVNDRIEFGSSTLVPSGPFCVAWWERLASSPINSFFPQVTFRTSASSSFIVYRSNFSNYTNLAWKDTTASGASGVRATNASDPATVLGQWRHFCVMGSDIKSNNASTFRAFENGQELTLTASGSFAGATFVNNLASDGLGTFSLTMLDDVRIYQRQPATNEISLLASEPGIGFKRRASSVFAKRYTYNPPKAKVFEGVRVRDHDYSSLRQGLVGAWCPSLANGGSGNTLADVSGYGNHGTLTNMSPDDWVSGQYGRALDFDGVNYVSIKSLTPALGFSFACWFKAVNASRTRQSIFSNAADNSPDIYLHLESISGATNAMNFYDGDGYLGASTTFTQDTNWHHYAWTTSASGVVKYYRDGLSLGSPANWTIIRNDNSASAAIGAIITLNNNGFTAEGQMDDCRRYSRTLMDNEIALLASKRGIGLQPSPTKFIAREKKTGLRRILMTGQT